jgi:hypothetical protein
MKQHSTKILSICLIVAIAYIYHQDKEHSSLVVENQQLTEQLAKANALLMKSEEKITLLEKKSIEGMLEETNKVVVSGWETLLDTVKEELTKAKERFNVQGLNLDDFNLDGFTADGSKSEAPSSTPNSQQEQQQKTQESPIIEGERT